MPLKLTDDESTLVQVMAWCLPATSHYQNQCWNRYMLLYDITRPQWVNTLRLRQNDSHFADFFKWIFFNENVLISISNFTEVCSLGFNWRWVSIGSGNGLVPNRQQGIIWTSVEQDLWCHMSPLGPSSFKPCLHSQGLDDLPSNL